jgi:hypothetical protein
MDIGAYTLRAWGNDQTIHYINGLETCCRQYADSPERVATVTALVTVGPSFDAEEPWDCLRDCGQMTMVTPGVGKAHGQEIIDRGYQRSPCR